ncbi:hypothetical protein F2P56_035558 [Juglans regia]|uniref:Protein MIZU-KUSSEI 1 n=2 Tax=Juglans regia TaxID=51240 RepID=A0A833TTY9_JUGRE|nr:protein MIZU-KUSSEI 1-like [Juglans regia]KAF5442953.1 hypothetical protein F2P56_035558 [Juglans regia]
MKLVTAKSIPHDCSFSFSRRYFHWKKKTDDEDDEEEVLTFSSSSHFSEDGIKDEKFGIPLPEISSVSAPRKKQSNSKLRSALTLFSKSRSSTRVIGTLFGYRRGHAHIAFQEDAKQDPAFFIELATPTSVLVREMASGLVRIALECEKKMDSKKGKKLVEETLWRTYCNGKKCGLAMRRECGAEELKVLKAVEPISMGAGVLPGSASGNGAGSEGELMYMRAKFERVVGSIDHSQAFYMINPDGAGGPELSVYLLRV